MMFSDDGLLISEKKLTIIKLKEKLKINRYLSFGKKKRISNHS